MGTALVTGASAGLGLEYAWQLAAANHNLVLVARREEKLEAIAAEIRNVAGVHVEVLARDLANRDHLDDVAARLTLDSPRPVGLLVNNAGFSLGKSFLSSEIAEEERALEVMVGAVMVLSHAAAHAMQRRGRGAILNVSSIAQGTAMGSYAASKAWVRSFTEGLATELAGTGVTATVTLPGYVHTDFHATAGLSKDRLPEPLWLTADQVVEESLAAVRRGEVISVPSRRYKAVAAVLGLTPRRLVRALTGSKAHRRVLGD
nr:SDR family NAD(P)-dependent oxidoreductase [Actinomycetales bacterium]